MQLCHNLLDKYLREVLYWFFHQVLLTQPCGTNTGYTRPCFYNEPILFIIFLTRTSQYLAIKQKDLKNFFPFHAIANTINNNSINTHFVNFQTKRKRKKFLILSLINSNKAFFSHSIIFFSIINQFIFFISSDEYL